MNLAPLEAYQRYGALGPDFLTWFLIHVLESDVPFPPSEPGLKYDIQGPLLFVSEEGEANKITLAGDEAACAPEVTAALRQGKRCARAKVLFTAVEDTWAFTLDAENFDMRSIKLPVPNTPDPEVNLSMRVQATLRLCTLVDELFDIFLNLRLDPEAWKAEIESWHKDS